MALARIDSPFYVDGVFAVAIIKVVNKTPVTANIVIEG